MWNMTSSAFLRDNVSLSSPSESSLVPSETPGGTPLGLPPNRQRKKCLAGHVGIGAMLITRTQRDDRSICAVLRSPPRVRGTCCIRVPAKIVRDPDPAIFTQKLIHAAGLPVTFNNPDLDTITIWPLRPLDNIAATIRNMSPDASSNGTRVDLSWSPWGIGLTRQPIASSFVDLPRAGFPGSQQTLTWPMPAALKAADRFAVFVKLVHPYDRDASNNEGAGDRRLPDQRRAVADLHRAGAQSDQRASNDITDAATRGHRAMGPHRPIHAYVEPRRAAKRYGASERARCACCRAARNAAKRHH
jgi:hypothetical protein